MIPEDPVGNSWPVDRKPATSEVGRLWETKPRFGFCEEYAILTLAPNEEGYPNGTYRARNEVWVSDVPVGDESVNVESVDVELTIPVS